MVVAVEVQNRGKTWGGPSKSFLACSPHHPLQLIPDVGQNPSAIEPLPLALHSFHATTGSGPPLLLEAIQKGQESWTRRAVTRPSPVPLWF